MALQSDSDPRPGLRLSCEYLICTGYEINIYHRLCELMGLDAEKGMAETSFPGIANYL